MTTTHDPRFAELLASYALGVLDGEDLRTMEEHLAEGCNTCDRELLALSKNVEAMAESLEPVAPSRMTRARTLASVASGTTGVVPGAEAPPVSASNRVPAFWRSAAAAALFFLAFTTWSTFDLRRQVRDLVAVGEGLANELAMVRQDLSTTRTELARAQLSNRIVSAPRTASVLLAGLDAAPESSARAYVDPSTSRAVFYAANLEALPADKTYQLWFIADGTPVSAGTFGVDGQGSGSLLVEDVAANESLQAWAVTIEPAGGVPQPTGDMVLLGSVA